MKKKKYEKLAVAFDAWGNCVKAGNEEWEDKHEETIRALVEGLPHGSGIDGETAFDFGRSRPNRLIIHSSFHHMDEYGGYDGWTGFGIVMTPDLRFGVNLKIVGTFPRKHRDTRNYLLEVFDEDLNSEIEG